MKSNWDFVTVQQLDGIEAVLILAVLLLLLLHPYLPAVQTTASKHVLGDCF